MIVDSIPNVGVAIVLVIASSAPMTRGMTKKCAERDPGGGQEDRRRDVAVDGLARFRMDRRDDEHPDLVEEDRQADDDRDVDRELEDRPDRVGRSERVERDAVEVRARDDRDQLLRGPQREDRDAEDRADADDETLTELPQVLRERHFLLVPLDIVRPPDVGGRVASMLAARPR